MTETPFAIDDVTAVLQDVARHLIIPRVRSLQAHEIESKVNPHDPEDMVTSVDRAVEAHLTQALKAFAPVAVIGEEAVYDDPGLLRLLESDRPVWLLDPIDGTKNLAQGDPRFGIMLAWVVRGVTRAAWIILPLLEETFVAELGGGVRLNGADIRVPPAPTSTDAARGMMHVRYMPDDLRQRSLLRMQGHYNDVGDARCAAVEYTDVLRGRRDFCVYFRLLPWDHAAPALILTEGGGRVEHLDGRPYSARSPNQMTVVARDTELSKRVRGWLA